MTLGELLEHIGKHVLGDRAEYAAGSPSAPLWADEVIVRYLNQAEQLFARRTYCILDSSTTASCDLALVEGTSSYALHKSILRVAEVRLSDSDAKLQHRSRMNTLNYTATGRPLYYDTDRGHRRITFYPPPDADAALLTAKLTVFRMPVAALATSALTASPEIPEEYHLDLCDWVAYKTLLHNDTDKLAPARAREFRKSFDEAARSARAASKLVQDQPTQFDFGGIGDG